MSKLMEEIHFANETAKLRFANTICNIISLVAVWTIWVTGTYVVYVMLFSYEPASFYRNMFGVSTIALLAYVATVFWRSHLKTRSRILRTDLVGLRAEIAEWLKGDIK